MARFDGFGSQETNGDGASRGPNSGSMSPRTIEALICSSADGIDASLRGTLGASEYLISDLVCEDSGKLSAEVVFHIIRVKQDKGYECVVIEYERIQS
jgi:hypothetical protein